MVTGEWANLEGISEWATCVVNSDTAMKYLAQNLANGFPISSYSKIVLELHIMYFMQIYIV